MPSAIVMERTGGPDVLEWREVTVGDPGPNEVRVRQTSVGLNYGDALLRAGHRPIPLPGIIGLDGAGIVEAVGSAVTEVSPGDRVAYTMLLGGYAEVRLLPADRVVKLPPDIDNRVAAGFISKGLTARYLLRDLYSIQPGDFVLVHAAAGGVGSLLAQWAHALGATVIGSVYNEAKADFARQCGCTHVIALGKQDLVAEVARITNGAKAAIVYDSVGLDTFLPSLDCLRPRGWMVTYGATSGMPPAIEPSLLGQKGALILTQPALMPYIPTRQKLLQASDDLFDAIRSKKISSVIQQSFPLREAAHAHRELESRSLCGVTTLEIKL